jgi:hypothetical protein
MFAFLKVITRRHAGWWPAGVFVLKCGGFYGRRYPCFSYALRRPLTASLINKPTNAMSSMK